MKFKKQWNDDLIKTAQSIGTKSYCIEAMFSFLLHPEWRDDKLQPCSFKYFYKTFPKKLAQKLRTKLRIDTEGQSTIVFLIITFYHKLFLTKYAANLLLIT